MRMVNNIQEYAANRNNIKNLVSHIDDSVKRLYLMIKTMGPMINYINNKTIPVVLYHGSMLPNLKTLKEGDIYTTPIFMSTSVIRDVAIRFARTNPSSGDNDIVLRIKVPPNKLKYFQYMYFGDHLNLKNCNKITEAEILMNLHSNLKLVKINKPQKVYYKVYDCHITKSLKTEQKIVTFFDFTFVGHSTQAVNQLLTNKLPL